MNIEIHHTADEYWFPNGHITIEPNTVIEGITENRIKLAHQIAALPDLIAALEVAAEVFREYEAHHIAKCSYARADSNRALATKMETALAKAKGEV